MVGAAQCKTCHEAEFAAWEGSHHDLAMQEASPESVLGDFNDAELTVHGITSRFFSREGKFFVNTDGQDGQMADFEITHTFGVEPLQQYLITFPDGRIQALGIAWDSRAADQGGQRWFHLYPDEPINHEDELHWTGLQQNWNYMCADCHSIDVKRGYDLGSDRFDTTWAEIDVACEACHGPGSAHIIWAQQGSELRASDVGWGLEVLLRDRDGASWVMQENGTARRNPPLANRSELEVCADCHSRRGQIAASAESSAAFLDNHVPAFLTEPLYHRDGQIRDEVYVWGSFLQSRMYAAGVTCSDCHEPHNLQLRAEGDAVCAQCHLPTKFAATSHHGHELSDSTPGCADCHMPQTTYMVVDPRRDHSIRIPSPGATVEFGVPNACAQCHGDQPSEGMVQKFDRLFPDAKPPFQDWTRAFDLARSGLPQAEISLLRVIADEAKPDIARASAVIELAPFLSPLSGQVLEDALKDSSPLVRLAALRTLEVLRPEHRYSFAKHLLGDELLAIRAEAGRVLAATPIDVLDASGGPKLKAAMDEYVATQMYNADRPESWLNLGNLHLAMGDQRQAKADYRQALKLDRDFGPAWLNLADFYRMQGAEIEARKVLDEGVLRLPEDAALHHALGLSLIRSKETQAALDSLLKSVELAPETPRYAYVYGVALNSMGRAQDAVSVLTDAHQRHPNDMQLLSALASTEFERGNLEQARGWAEKILAINPADPGASQFLDSLE